MHTALKVNVRTSLALAILAAIVLSWVISMGTMNYFNYLSMKSFHDEMAKYPGIYPVPFPEPKFGIVEFLTGRPSFPPPPGNSKNRFMQPPPNRPMQFGPPRAGSPNNRIFGNSPLRHDIKWLILRFLIALGLAALTGSLLGRKFTRPLTQLANGAKAFHSGDFGYRIPVTGSDEFADVATAMNEMAQQVSAHIGTLEEDAERRRQFLADIAHELRSPVTTMRTMVGALKDGVAEQPERRERAISALADTSERLLRLVQDLMELAKLDLNELPLNKKPVNLADLLTASIQSHEAEAAASGIILHPLYTSSAPMITADPDRITQVIDNILQNAISYAGEGAEVTTSIENTNPVIINIRDTGKGISASDLPFIFDSFYRADSARTPGECHSGLGLSIARRLVEVHNGQLTISSKEGKGTTVTITIPLDTAR